MLAIDSHNFISLLQGCRVLSWLSGLGSSAFWNCFMEKRIWISIEIANINDMFNIPKLPGCYVIYMQKDSLAKYDLIYIGCSTINIQSRIKSHIKKIKRRRSPHHYSKTDTLYFSNKNAVLHKLNTKGYMYKVKYKLSRKLGEELMWEYRLIKRLRPIYNIRSNEFVSEPQKEIEEKEEMAYPWYCCK